MFGNEVLHARYLPAAGKLLWLGIAFLVLGTAALVFPMVSTLAAAIYVGLVLLISGSFMLFGSFSIHGTGPFFGALLLSVLSIALGVYLVCNPTSGAVALTLVVGVVFALQAAFELFLAFEMRPSGAAGAMALSAIASAVIAFLVLAGWPVVSHIVLGILVGVNFLTSGVAFVAISRALKRLA